MDDNQNRRTRRYVKLREKFAQAEKDLSRALRRWDKLRAQLKRAEVALERIPASELDLRLLCPEINPDLPPLQLGAKDPNDPLPEL